MKIVKIRKRLARLFEFQWLLTRPDADPTAVSSLAKKLEIPPSAASLPKVKQMIAATKKLLDEVEYANRTEVFKKWQDHLRSDPEAVSRWLKTRDMCSVDVVKGRDSTVHTLGM